MSDLLSRPTLILNRNWQAVGVASVSRALAKLYGGGLRVVDPDDYQLYDWDDWLALEPDSGETCIQTPRFRIRPPEVAALIDYDGVTPHQAVFSRRNLFVRDRFTCQYCGARPGAEHLTIDHIHPRARGGGSSWDNCVLACRQCNSLKADLTLKQAKMKLRRPPEQPNWQPAFVSGARLASWRNFLPQADE